jgi:hypothetical protein
MTARRSVEWVTVGVIRLPAADGWRLDDPQGMLNRWQLRNPQACGKARSWSRFPKAEPVVGQLRARLDRAASRGIPAHVTVLYPFVPPGQITPAVLDKAAAAVASATPI